MEEDGTERRRRYERNEGTYSRRAVVIGGNFIILRHYPRYCNAIKLDTLRTPCGTGGISRALLPFASLLPSPSASRRRSGDEALALLRFLRFALTALPRSVRSHVYLVRFG